MRQKLLKGIFLCLAEANLSTDLGKQNLRVWFPWSE